MGKKGGKGGKKVDAAKGAEGGGGGGGGGGAVSSEEIISCSSPVLVTDCVSMSVFPPENPPQSSPPSSSPSPSFPLPVPTYQKQKLSKYSLIDDLIFLVPNILTPEECECWIKWGEHQGKVDKERGESRGGNMKISPPLLFPSLFSSL